MTIATIENCFKTGEDENERYFGQIGSEIIKEVTQVFYFDMSQKIIVNKWEKLMVKRLSKKS